MLAAPPPPLTTTSCGWKLACTHMLAKYIHLHQARINIARTAQAPRDRFLYELGVALHAYCRGAYARSINGNEGAVESILWLSDGNRPEDSSSYHTLTCKNNVILECYGVWWTYTVSFTHGYVDDDKNYYVHACLTLEFGKKNRPTPLPTP